MKDRLARFLDRLLASLGRQSLKMEHERGRQWPKRYSYQERYIAFPIKPGDRVIDIGSGADPFPLATHLCDPNVGPSPHRYEPLPVGERPTYVADVHGLPFPDRAFDFAYCCHVLEHVKDPVAACIEIQRIAKRGYIETPTLCKDALFAWARGMHRWYVISHGRSLLFFEYTNRQLDGCRSTHWRDLIHQRTYNPLQDFFFDNQDIFNVMFLWEERFRVEVFRNDEEAPEIYEP